MPDFYFELYLSYSKHLLNYGPASILLAPAKRLEIIGLRRRVVMYSKQIRPQQKGRCNFALNHFCVRLLMATRN